MKMNKYARRLSVFLLVAVGTLGCDTSYDKQNDKTETLLTMGIGCLATSPITMKSTTYDMDNQIKSASEQVILNMSVQSSQPSMKSMYEMYAGVELEVDWAQLDKLLTDPMRVVKQNPLLTQFWALKKMASSIDARENGTWMDSDDTIDPLLGYFETTRREDRYCQIKYSDFGITPSSRIDYIVEDNRKVETNMYEAGADNIFGNKDDLLVKTTVYQYNRAGKMEKAINYSYSGDVREFENVYVFTYDVKGRLESMTSYDGDDENDLTNRMTWGSYSTLTWGDTGGKKTLDIVLGLRVFFIAIWDQPVIRFHYEFNNDGTIHKMIQFEPISETNIDTCYVYVYTPGTMLNMGDMNDASVNYSDDEETQVSRTVNELVFGEN